MKSKPIRSVFWVLVAVFILNMLMIFLEPPSGYVFFTGIGIFFLLGAALLVLTIKQKISGKPRVFLLLTSIAVVAMPVFIVLHNLVYAAAIGLFGADVWGAAGDEPFFFILALIVCPLAFLAGAVGTIVLAVKDRAAA
jgi:hypothetical protein